MPARKQGRKGSPGWENREEIPVRMVLHPQKKNVKNKILVPKGRK